MVIGMITQIIKIGGAIALFLCLIPKDNKLMHIRVCEKIYKKRGGGGFL